MKHRPTIHIKLSSQLIQLPELIHRGRLTNSSALKQVFAVLRDRKTITVKTDRTNQGFPMKGMPLSGAGV